MNQDTVVNLATQAMSLALKIAGPMLLVGLVIGLLVSVFQAVTQIQEQSLSLIPKIVGVGVLIVRARPVDARPARRLRDRTLYTSIPSLIGEPLTLSHVIATLGGQRAHRLLPRARARHAAVRARAAVLVEDDSRRTCAASSRSAISIGLTADRAARPAHPERPARARRARGRGDARRARLRVRDSASLMGAVESAGSVIDVLSGFSFGALIDPINGNQERPSSRASTRWSGTLIFLVIGGDAWTLRGLARTFHAGAADRAHRSSASLVGGAEQVVQHDLHRRARGRRAGGRRAADHRRRLRRRLARRAAAERVRGRLPAQGRRRRCWWSAPRCRSLAGWISNQMSRERRRPPSARCTWPERMADRDDRTEKATPKHRKRAREKGQVARSTDLSGAVVARRRTVRARA